ncbi:MAG TPA: hypothetical protein VGC19_05685 [Rhodanobacter sp.]
MNEFEWRRQMRELRQPVTPQRDIWASIDAALEDAEPPHASTNTSNPTRTAKVPHRWLIAAGLAASLLIVGGISWHLRQVPAAVTVANAPSPSAKWKPSDPRLAGAAIELDAARMELQQAIQQAPGSSGLQRILARTELQQTQLRQLTREPG